MPIQTVILSLQLRTICDEKIMRIAPVGGYLTLLALLLIIGALWPGFSQASSESLRISLEPPGLYEAATGANSWTIYLDGVIESGADKRVAREISRLPNAPFDVYFNSPGGDFLTAIKLGRLLRTKAAWTHIGKRGPTNDNRTEPGVCYSACALAYLGGHYRFGTIGSTYGVHRTWKDSASADSDLDVGQIISAAAAAYIREMGVDGGLLDLMVRAGKNEVYLLSDAEQKMLRVTNNGRAPAEWSLKLTKGHYYLRGMQDTMYGQGKFILYCTSPGLTLHSIYEAGPNSQALAKDGQFHSLLIDGHTVALPRPRRVEDDHGYLNATFELTREQTGQIFTARESVGHAMQISRDAPTFLGYRVDLNVAASRQLREFIYSCSTKN